MDQAWENVKTSIVVVVLGQKEEETAIQIYFLIKYIIKHLTYSFKMQIY
jgi:hypothetical protein